MQHIPPAYDGRGKRHNSEPYEAKAKDYGKGNCRGNGREPFPGAQKNPGTEKGRENQIQSAEWEGEVGGIATVRR